MRRLVLAIALACVFPGMVLAGEIPSTGATTPQPSSPVERAVEIHGTGGEIPATAIAPETLTIILALLGIVP